MSTSPLVVLCALLGIHAAIAHAAPSEPSVPALRADQLVTLEEQSETNQARKLAFVVPAQDVDLNSIINIRVTLPKPSVVVGKNQRLQEFSRRLSRLSDSLTDTLRIRGVLEKKPRDSPQFQFLATELQNRLNTFGGEMDRYYALLQESDDAAANRHATEFRERLNATLRGEQPYDRLIADELRWIVERIESEAAEAQTARRSVALTLRAYVIRDGRTVPQHLEHYDDIALGMPVPIDKLNTVPSPAEQVKLGESYAKAEQVSEALNKVGKERGALEQALNSTLSAAGVDLSNLQLALKALHQEILALRDVDLTVEVRTALDTVTTTLDSSTLTSDQKASLRITKNKLNELANHLTGLNNAITSLKKKLDDMTPRLDRAALQASESPVDTLLSLLASAAAAVQAADAINAEITALQRDIEPLDTKLSELVQLVEALIDSVNSSRGLPEATINELNKSLTQLQNEKIGPLSNAYRQAHTELKKIVDALNKLDRRTRDNINNYAATAVAPPDLTRLVMLGQAKDTWLDLRTIPDRQEGDVVTIEAALHRVETEGGLDEPRIGKRLDSGSQQLRMLRYGTYGSYNVGIAYVSSAQSLAGESDPTRSFQPHVSWMLRYRCWDSRGAQEGPVRHAPKFYEQLGLGLHSVALDLNRDNENEIGLGISIGLFDDLLQLGYGRDLSLGEGYYFIATRLFQFGKRQ